ncbi:MAG: CotH kinase family protein [Bacteroides sp.]|nr:CotH kinase family protein [Roseburia sp.]MCM1345765.1 CotH kinase family protein [Bacteroides sp.]MCM1420140.1 CotH kinase family protein [Bacteroides sp.]
MMRLQMLAAAMFITLCAGAQAKYERLTNLPAVYIRTYDNVPITSKTTYVLATMWYVDENDQVTQYDSLEIRGRGNSTWGLAKKPYKLKFHVKEKFLGNDHANAKKWTMLANAGDKTLMRNAVTSLLGEFTGLPFNPAAKFVDLTLNGTYIGNYQISDQIEVKKKRVHITEQDYPLSETSDITGGYLLEVDGFHDGNCFTTGTGRVGIRIHYPDDEEIATRQTLYIRTYINNFETALMGNDYLDAEKGYRHWVDSVSLANWYIATEVSANIDGFYSTYFYKNAQDSLLYWGPLWDYDIAYGNDTRKGDTSRSLMTDVGYGDTRVWMNRMWNDPWFANLINRRYRELVNKGMEDYLLGKVDSINTLIQESQELNYKKWGINRRMYNERVLYSSYDQYVNNLKSFISTHIEYLQTAFRTKRPAGPTPAFVAENYYYRFTNANTTKAIDIVGQSENSGAGICTWSNIKGRESEDWVITPVGEYFHITNRKSGMALNDPTTGNVGPTTNVGTQLNTAEPDSLDDRQLWLITPQGTAGYYNLTNKHSQHTANLNGGNAADGTQVLSYTTDSKNTTSLNRLWYIIPGDDLPIIEPDAIAGIEPEEYALAYNADSKTLHFGSETPELLVFMANVYDTNGRKIRTFRADETCSVEDLPKGTYIVSWKCGNKVRSVKFMK